MLEDKPKIIVIAGPTGTGKTGAALELADRTKGQIISADAMAVYRDMDIGTAKPTPAEQARVRHHLIDVVNPDEDFDAALFGKYAGAIARKLTSENTPVIVAGGTGLYIKALIHGLFSAGKSDTKLREKLNREAQDQGLLALHKRLEEKDPEAGARIHKNDAFRIIRALEVIELTGQPLSKHHTGHAFGEPAFDALFFALSMDREALYRRIDKRVDLMLEQGLLAEVRGLLDRGYSPGLKSMRSIGYRHMADALLEHIPFDEAVRLMKRDTRRFAKRQFTWFKSVPGVLWVKPEELGEVATLATQHLESGKNKKREMQNAGKTRP